MYCLFLVIPQIVCAEVNKPNIIFIFADDLGIESLRPYGGHSTLTPNIDKLANAGMLFTHCFANPKCSPSRAEVMTGTYPGITGITRVLASYEQTEFLDPKKFNSFANQLKKAGYTTAIAGKWNLSYLEKNNTITPRCRSTGSRPRQEAPREDQSLVRGKGQERRRLYFPRRSTTGTISNSSMAEGQPER